MILVDAVLPDCCLNCSGAAGYGCKITMEVLESRVMSGPGRPKSCPLIEVEEKRIRERVSHVDWQDRTVYVRKEETHDR
jgi:hypothetical protein